MLFECFTFTFLFNLIKLGTFLMKAMLFSNLLIVLPMREPSIFRGIDVSLLGPVIGSNFEIE